MNIQMVDLSNQYLRLKEEIDAAIQEVFQSAAFINGAQVQIFCDRLSTFLDVPHTIPCGNGTDALQMALQALHIGHESDVIVPAFTYIAPLEAVASVGATPIVVDVDPVSFNINLELIEKAIEDAASPHLFEQTKRRPMILPIIMEI
jgi:dTDP-4-amino-4,6-dideoxygalactose transaminase